MKTNKAINYRNTHGAYFEKDAESNEGFYHFCDHIERKYMPEIWQHDIKSVLFIGTEKLTIKFCPICGKCLD